MTKTIIAILLGGFIAASFGIAVRIAVNRAKSKPKLLGITFDGTAYTPFD